MRVAPLGSDLALTRRSAMRLDSAAYIRIELANGLGASPSGAAFATNTGDVLELTCYGVGVYRLRVGANTRADYGLLEARAQRCDVSASGSGTWTFAAGDTRLEIDAAPFALRLHGADLLRIQSVTDELADGATRMPAIARNRSSSEWTASFALSSGAPVYGFGARPGALDARGAYFAPGSAARGDAVLPFCWSSSAGAAWGVANTESNQSQPVPACAVPERHTIEAAATNSVVGLANFLKPVIGELLSPYPHQA